MTVSKEKKEEKKAELIKLTGAFCDEHLNDEYKELIVKLIGKMSRKRDVPFVSGRIDIWAAAVIHAVGTVNFLFDRGTEPYVSAADIHDYFDTKSSTVSQKSKKIRDLFKMTYFDGEFSIESVQQKSPFNNLTLLNGLIVPAHLGSGKVQVEEWEVRAAHVLGMTEIKAGQLYQEAVLEKWLAVDEESLRLFYDHAKQYLTFPFSGIYAQPISAQEFAEYEVVCERLDEEIKIDPEYGILTDCVAGEQRVKIPLDMIALNQDDPNFTLIEAYCQWFWNYE